MRPADHTEVDDLRRRFTALESELARCQQLANELRESDERLRILSESTVETVAVLDRGVIVEVNDRALSMFGYELADVIGRHATEFVVPEARELVARHVRSGYEQPYEALALRRDGSTFVGRFRGRGAIYRGRPARVTMVLDLDEPRTAALAAPARCDDPRRSLVAPVLAIAEGVVLLPLLGALDPERVEHTLGLLLAGVAEHRARAVILDLSGAAALDLAVADLIVRAARATRLLGARTIVTGVRSGAAAVAAAEREPGIEVRGTLHDGVREALART